MAENLEIKRDPLAARRRTCASPARSSPPTPAASRWRASPRASTANSAATSWARTSSIRRATCTWPKSSPARRPHAGGAATGSPISCDLHLGKGVVLCKDTPNFIANRIGCFWGAKIAQLTEEGDYTVEEVDALTGPLIGLPKSASFRLMDIVGLDVWVHVLRNLYEAVPDDPARELFRRARRDAADDGARLAGREARPGLLQTRGQGWPRRSWCSTARRWNTIPRRSRAFPRWRRRAASRIWASACARWSAGDDRAGRVPVAAVPRFLPLLRADGAGDFRPHRGDRSRHALGLRASPRARSNYWDALGVPADRSSACIARASRFRRDVERMLARRRAQLLPGRRPGRRAAHALLRSSIAAPGPSSNRARAWSCSPNSNARAASSESNAGRLAGGPGRWRAVPGVPQQDEHAGRGRGQHAARRPGRDRHATSRRWWWPTTARTSAPAPT